MYEFIHLNINNILPDLYNINEYRDIRNNQSNKILHPKKDKDGYLTVNYALMKLYLDEYINVKVLEFHN